MERPEGSSGLAERELLAGERGEQEPAQYGSAQYTSAELTLTDPGLASGLAAAFERLIGLFRSLSPANGLSLTAAATLATLERSGPCRLTSLAIREGVTQPAMTQLIGRLAEAGLVERISDPADGRVVQVRLTADGKATLAAGERFGPTGWPACWPCSAPMSSEHWLRPCPRWRRWPAPSVRRPGGRTRTGQGQDR